MNKNDIKQLSSGLSDKTLPTIGKDLTVLGDVFQFDPGTMIEEDIFMVAENVLSSIYKELIKNRSKVIEIPVELDDEFVEIKSQASALLKKIRNKQEDKTFFKEVVELGRMINRIAPKISKLVKIIIIASLNTNFYS
ncbi:hypothetical protein [Haliscomenobacter sp.]|uniref:hypothetical protein n=1 Tax=Haliscomenobacter sp. TaxID=2717303 RepID=UPI003594867A